MESNYDSILEEKKIILHGHFVLNSWLHTDRYFDKDKILLQPKARSYFSGELVKKIEKRGIPSIDVMMGPAYAGSVLGNETARIWSETNYSVLNPFTEKIPESKKTDVSRFQEYLEGKGIFLIDDVLTSGDSLLDMILQLRKIPGVKILGAAVLCNRNNVTTKQLGDIPILISLMNPDLPSWPHKDCKLCKDNLIPVNQKKGRGKAFMEGKAPRDT